MIRAARLALRSDLLFSACLVSLGLMWGGQKVRNSPGVEPRAMPFWGRIMELIGAERAGQRM